MYEVKFCLATHNENTSEKSIGYEISEALEDSNIGCIDGDIEVQEIE